MRKEPFTTIYGTRRTQELKQAANCEHLKERNHVFCESLYLFCYCLCLLKCLIVKYTYPRTYVIGVFFNYNKTTTHISQSSWRKFTYAPLYHIPLSSTHHHWEATNFLNFILLIPSLLSIFFTAGFTTGLIILNFYNRFNNSKIIYCLDLCVYLYMDRVILYVSTCNFPFSFDIMSLIIFNVDVENVFIHFHCFMFHITQLSYKFYCSWLLGSF